MRKLLEGISNEKEAFSTCKWTPSRFDKIVVEHHAATSLGGLLQVKQPSLTVIFGSVLCSAVPNIARKLSGMQII